MERGGIFIRRASEGDSDAIRLVNRDSFGGDDEANLCDRLRSGGHVRAWLVAEDEAHQIRGHILFGELAIDTARGPVDALALAPLAVVPAFQGRGIGSALVREGLSQCSAMGHRIVVVLGRPEFYTRFGFSAEPATRLRSAYSGPAFLAMGLTPGALDGVEGDVRYPPPFDMLDTPEGPPSVAGPSGL